MGAMYPCLGTELRHQQGCEAVFRCFRPGGSRRTSHKTRLLQTFAPTSGRLGSQFWYNPAPMLCHPMRPGRPQIASDRPSAPLRQGLNSFQCPSETTSTVPSITVTAVASSMAYVGTGSRADPKMLVMVARRAGHNAT
jgi:hypothetical protein